MGIIYFWPRITKKHSTAQTGFTIVELIVVIVVIAILAAITLVAYSGIKTKANNTKTIAAVKSYIDILEVNLTMNGPVKISDTVSDLYFCLGTADSYPAAGAMAAGVCMNGGGAYYVSNQFNTALKDYAEISLKTETATTTNGSIRIRGIVGAFPGTLLYVLQGENQDCAMGKPGGLLPLKGATICNYEFKNEVFVHV